MTSRDSDGRAESRVFSSKPSNFSMVAEEIKISPGAAGNFTLTAPGLADITFDQAELNMMKKGTIPSGILPRITPAGITKDQLIRAARSVIPQEINVQISKQDGVYGYIRNGSEGLVQWRKNTPAAKQGDPPRVISLDIIRFSGSFGPVYLIDGETRGLGLKLNGISYTPMRMADFYLLVRQELSIPAPAMQKLKEVLNTYVQDAIDSGQAVDYRSSPIYVDDESVKVDFPHVGDLQDILTKLRIFHDKASHPLAYRTVLAWSLKAPLHDEIKRHADVSRRIQAPQVMMAGKTQGGKTPLGDFFIGKGYGLNKDAYFYPYQTVRTAFMLMRHLGESNLPALFDDLPSDWLQQHADDLKAYVQTGHFGDRGKADQTVQEYRGKRSFIGTVNSSIRIDDDLAASRRIIILRFTEQNRRRKNLPEWNALIDGLPDGFMVEIFRVVFEGQNIKDIAKDAEKFQSPADWINYVIGKLNMLSQWFGIAEWPLFKEDNSTDDDSNALEIAQAFLAEWRMIEKNSEDFYDRSLESQVRAIKYRSPIEGQFCVEWRGTRNYIWFTSGAFKTLMARHNLKLPYRNATDFLNNIPSSTDGIRVENEGKMKSKKIAGMPLKAFCMSLPVEGEIDNE